MASKNLAAPHHYLTQFDLSSVKYHGILIRAVLQHMLQRLITKLWKSHIPVSSETTRWQMTNPTLDANRSHHRKWRNVTPLFSRCIMDCFLHGSIKNIHLINILRGIILKPTSLYNCNVLSFRGQRIFLWFSPISIKKIEGIVNISGLLETVELFSPSTLTWDIAAF